MRREASNHTSRNLTDELKTFTELDAGDAQVLRDDYAPVEELLNPLIGAQYRPE